MLRYSPKGRRWTTGPDLPVPLGWGAAAEVGGRLYLAGGLGRRGYVSVFSDATYVLND